MCLYVLLYILFIIHIRFMCFNVCVTNEETFGIIANDNKYSILFIHLVFGEHKSSAQCSVGKYK